MTRKSRAIEMFSTLSLLILSNARGSFLFHPFGWLHELFIYSDGKFSTPSLRLAHTIHEFDSPTARFTNDRSELLVLLLLLLCVVIDFRWKIIQKLPEKLSTRQNVYGGTLTIVAKRAHHIYPKPDSSCSRSLSRMAPMQCSEWKYILWNHVWLYYFFLVWYVSLNLEKVKSEKKWSKWLHNGHFHGHTELCVLHFSYRKMANIHQHIPPTNNLHIYLHMQFHDYDVVCKYILWTFVRFFRLCFTHISFSTRYFVVVVVYML